MYDPQESERQRRRRTVIWRAVAAAVIVGLLGGLVSLSLGSIQARVATLVSNARPAAEKLSEIASTLGESGDSSSAEGAGSSSAASKRAIYPHIVAAKGDPVTVPAQTFAFEGKQYSVTPTVDSGVYWGAKKAERSMSELPSESRADWVAAYYRCFVEDPLQQATIDSACEQLRAIASGAGLDSDRYLELIAKYVQSIPYDTAKAEAGGAAPLFPVETIVEGKGVCSDKSLLLAALLAHEGYAVALLDFSAERHMAVGVKGDGNMFGDSGYLFLETTAPYYISEVPDQYSGGTVLGSSPQAIPIGTGSAAYTAGADVARLLYAREAAGTAADALYAQASKERLTKAKANEINRKLLAAYNADIYLRSDVVDGDGKQISQFMDRAQAIEWLDANDWWS